MKQTPEPSRLAAIETLEGRTLLVYWPAFTGLEQVFQQYPWLNGQGHGVAVVDKGIDYLHPRLGGNPATNTPSPRVVNVWDWQGNDADPFPTDLGSTRDPAAGHGTGVTGLLVMPPYRNPQDGQTYQGVLQGAKVYNLRTHSTNSQATIASALQWVVDHHVEHNITAVNLTDFVGTAAATPLYDAQIRQLWDQGVFVATPVANDWLGDPDEGDPGKAPIGYPAKHAHIFGVGGLSPDGTGVRAETQRGPGLDVLAPAVNVWLPYYTPSTRTHEWVPGTGNSWGAPIVVGTAVLLRQIDPTLKPAEIMQIIQDSGVWVADTSANAAHTGIAGYKRINVLGAVELAYRVRDDASDAGSGNDTLATATPIPLDASGRGSIAGRKLLIHDHDYYTFTATAAGGAYRVSALAGARLLDGNGSVIATAGADGRLTRQLAAGKYYVHLYDADRSLAGTYAVGVEHDPAPAVVPNSFAATPHAITIKFSEDVGPSLSANDLIITLPGGGAAPVSPTGVTFDPATRTARFAFATPLPDGDYRATIAAAAVTDPAGSPLASDFSQAFFVVAGDATGDRTVDFNDLVRLAQNYGAPAGKAWTDGDFTGEGAVDFNDLVILAQRYGTSLPPPSSAAGAMPVPSRETDETRDVGALFSTTPVVNPEPPSRRPSTRSPRG